MKLKKRIKKLELMDKVRNQQIAELQKLDLKNKVHKQQISELQYAVDELMRIINTCDLELITKRSDEL